MCSDCDVVIVNYNAGKLLSECVGSVLSQSVSNIIVVDNASTDNSIEALEECFGRPGQLKIIRNTKNVGFASGCNLGLELSSSKHILFLNPDCVASPGSIDKLLKELVAREQVGVVGGLLLNPNGTEQPGGRRVVPTPRRAFIRAFGLSKLGKTYPRLFSDFLLHREELPEQPVEVEGISGACMLVRRSAVDEVGGWDEGFFMHCEDLDWCMRFRSSGWKILFIPSASFVHYGGVCSKSRLILTEWYKHKGMVRFYRKHFSSKYSPLLMVFVTMGVWLRFCIVLPSLWGRQLYFYFSALRKKENKFSSQQDQIGR